MKIEPAMTPGEWATLGPDGVGHPIMPSTVADVEFLDPSDLVKVIAIANAALPDSAPRKITREKVRRLWEAVDTAEDVTRNESDNLAFLAALESYLPPEPE